MARASDSAAKATCTKCELATLRGSWQMEVDEGQCDEQNESVDQPEELR